MTFVLILLILFCLFDMCLLVRMFGWVLFAFNYVFGSAYSYEFTLLLGLSFARVVALSLYIVG